MNAAEWAAPDGPARDHFRCSSGRSVLVLVEDFTFKPGQRRALVRCLDAAGIDKAAVADIEQRVPTLRVLLASRGATRKTAEQLLRLAKASERFVSVLGPPRVDDGPPKDDDPLDFAGRELLTQRLGYAAFLTNLTESHWILQRALDLLNQERGKRLARAGAPNKAARAWLLRELEEILSRHRGRSRRKILEALARHGVKTPAKATDLPVATCARIVLEAIGQPVPETLQRVANRTVKNLPRNT